MPKAQSSASIDLQLFALDSGSSACSAARKIISNLKKNAAVVIRGTAPKEFAPEGIFKYAAEGTAPESGFIYAAPPGKSLDISNDLLRLTESDRADPAISSFLLEQLGMLSSQAMIAVDFNYRIIWFNNMFSELYRTAFGNAVTLGESILDYAQTTDKKRLQQVYDEVFSGKTIERDITTGTGEIKDMHLSLHYKPMTDEDGKVRGAFVTAADLTEITRHRALMQKKEKFYKSLIENAGEAVAVLDMTGRAIYLSTTVEQVLGYTAEEAMRLNLFETVHPEDVAIVQESLENSLKNPGKTIPGKIARMRMKNGRYRYFDATVTNMLHDPDIGGIVNNFRDVTETLAATAETDFEKSIRNALINNTKDFIWSVDNNYRLLAANDAMMEGMKHMTGRKPNIGDSMLNSDYYPKDYLNMWRSMYDRCLAGENIELVTNDPEKEGVSASVYDTAINPIREGDKIIGVACFSHDITENKRQQTLLKERNAFIEAALDNLPIGIAVNKIDSNQAVLMNKMFSNIYGWPAEMLTDSETFFDLVYPDKDYRTEIKKTVLDDIRSGETERMNWNEIKITTQKGEERLINARNIPLYDQNQMISTVIDVTDAVKAREGLRHSNERYELLTKVSFDAVWDYEVEKNQVYWGAGMQENFGHSFENSYSTLEQWEELIHPEDHFHVIHSFSAALNNPEAYEWGADYRMLKSDGTYADVTDRAYIIRDKQGKTHRVVGAVQDSTAQKVYEKNLLELNAKLKKRARELSESNAELEQFAYVASHDLQEPLRMVTSFLSQIEKKYNDLLDETGRQYIFYATDGAKRMRQIILDLLEYSRVGRAGEGYGEVDIKECAQSAMLLLKTVIDQTDAKIQIDHLPVIKANRTYIIQMYQNLLSNALKYRKDHVTPRIELGYTESDEYHQFFVKDNGIGIKKEFFDKIFSIFQRLHVREKYSGTGIGLAICKKIAETHQGEMTVESKEGEGSTFYFTVRKEKN